MILFAFQVELYFFLLRNHTSGFRILLWGASQYAGSEAAVVETCKRHAFECFDDGSDCEFVVMTMDSFGLLGNEVVRLLSYVGDVAASDGYASKPAFVKTIRDALSCALWQGSA